LQFQLGLVKPVLLYNLSSRFNFGLMFIQAEHNLKIILVKCVYMELVDLILNSNIGSHIHVCIASSIFTHTHTHTHTHRDVCVCVFMIISLLVHMHT